MSQTIISQESSAPFVVNVKLLSDEIFKFEVDRNIKVQEFKALISPTVRVPVESMRIIFAGKLLLDHKPICQYVQESGLIIHLIARSTPQTEEPMPVTSGLANMLDINSSQENQDDDDQFNFMNIMGNLFGATSFVNGHNSTSMIQISFGSIPISGISNSIEVVQTEPTHPAQRRQPRQPQNQQPTRISYSEIDQLDRNIDQLTIPRQRETAAEQNLTADGVIRYLRRLYHQSNRALNQLSISLNDNPTEVTSESLQSFIPILESLNSSNTVAINCLNELKSRRQSRRAPRNNRDQSNNNQRTNAQNFTFTNNQVNNNRDRLGMVNRNATNHLNYEQSQTRFQNNESNQNVPHESIFARILQNRLNSQQNHHPPVPSMSNNMFAESNAQMPRQGIQPYELQSRHQQMQQALSLSQTNIFQQLPYIYPSEGPSSGRPISRHQDDQGETKNNPQANNRGRDQ